MVLLFATILTNEKTKKYIKYINKIGHYTQQNTTDMICFDNNNNNNIILVEVVYKLSDIFKNDLPHKSFDYVICWSVDLEINEKNTKCVIITRFDIKG